MPNVEAPKLPPIRLKYSPRQRTCSNQPLVSALFKRDGLSSFNISMTNKRVQQENVNDAKKRKKKSPERIPKNLNSLAKTKSLDRLSKFQKLGQYPGTSDRESDDEGQSQDKLSTQKDKRDVAFEMDSNDEEYDDKAPRSHWEYRAKISIPKEDRKTSRSAFVDKNTFQAIDMISKKYYDNLGALKRDMWLPDNEDEDTSSRVQRVLHNHFLGDFWEIYYQRFNKFEKKVNGFDPQTWYRLSGEAYRVRREIAEAQREKEVQQSMRKPKLKLREPSGVFKVSI